MADTKVSGSRRTTQHPPDATAFETPQPSTRYIRVFHSSVDLKVARLRWLRLFHLQFPGRCVKACRLSIEENSTRATFEITEDLYQPADEDWAMFGRMLPHWKNKFNDPSEMLLEGERLRQKVQNTWEQAKTAKRQASDKEQAR
jgi:hypothetical protein